MSDLDSQLLYLREVIRNVLNPPHGTSVDAAEAYRKIAELRPDLRGKDISEVLGISQASVSYLKTIAESSDEDKARIREADMGIKTAYMWLIAKKRAEVNMG